MKLEINLSDRAEIEAAVPLLQLILDNTQPSAGPRMNEAIADGLPNTTRIVGGAAAPAPLAFPVPSTAAVAPLPTAPAVPPVSSTAPPAPPAPAVPPAASVPAPPAAATPSSPAPGVDVDSKGLPWDDRIHASTKAKIANGTWKYKRGVDDATVAAVEAELRARMATAPVAAPAAPEAPTMTPAQAFGGAAAPAPLPPAAIAPPAAPSVPAPPAAPLPGADPTTFEQLMPRLSAAAGSGVLPPTAVNEACQTLGLASVVALQTSPQMVPHVWAALRQKYPGLA